jgi:hypothetical protein
MDAENDKSKYERLIAAFEPLLMYEDEKRLREELRKLEAEMMPLQEKRRELVKDIRKILRNRKNITDYVKTGLPKIELFDEYLKRQEVQPLNPSMKLGDAIEAIIKTDGPQFQKDIINKIRNAEIRLSEKNPYPVIYAAVYRDKEKRFKILPDGRVDLALKAKGNQPATKQGLP